MISRAAGAQHTGERHGLFRKMTSISTLGIVDYRSDKERIAKYTRQTRNATRAAAAQNAMMLEQQRQQVTRGGQPQQIAPPPYVPDSIPAGWYDDGHGVTRWYDGQQWTPHTR